MNFTKWHKKENNEISIVAAKIKYTFPYGNINLDNKGNFKKDIVEKPNFNLLANTGFYIINKKAINLIPNTGISHMTDLIRKSKVKQFKNWCLSYKQRKLE